MLAAAKVDVESMFQIFHFKAFKSFFVELSALTLSFSELSIFSIS